MSQGHINSRLLLKNQVVAITSDVFHLTYDFDESGILYGDLVVPQANSVFTLRKYDGKFGGAIAVEDSTTNLIASTGLTFSTLWTSISGCAVTLTQGQFVPQWGTSAATRIQTSGGTSTTQYLYDSGVGISGSAYTSSLYIKNNGANPVIVSNNFNTVTVNSGEFRYIVPASGIADGVIHPQIQFRANIVGNQLDFTVFNPQIEQKAFPTSFISSTRAQGFISYPKEVLNPNAFTVNTWVKFNTSAGSSLGIYQPIFELNSGNHALNRLMLMYSTTTGGKLQFWSSNGVTEVTSSSTFIPTIGIWYMLTLSFDGTKYNTYINGVLVQTLTSTLICVPNPTALFHVGGRYFGVNNGLIDDFIVAPYAFSNEDIMAIYLSGVPIYNPYDKRSYAY